MTLYRVFKKNESLCKILDARDIYAKSMSDALKLCGADFMLDVDHKTVVVFVKSLSAYDLKLLGGKSHGKHRCSSESF